MQDLTAMLLFAKVVEHGSYSAAARATGLQISKLSRRIAELERHLGVRLLQRTTRKVSVTDVGRTYYLHCAALAAEAAAAQEAIERTRSAPQGLVRMSCPISLIQGTVGPILARFLIAHPLVNVYVEMTNRRVDLVEEGFDIALRVRTPPLEASDLAMRKLSDSAAMLVASPAFLDTHERPAHPRDLARLPTLSTTTPGDKYSWHFREKDCTPITVTHAPRLMTDSFEALRAAATAGVGVAYLPQFVVQESVSAGALERVLPDFSLPPGLLHAVFPSRRGMVPAVRALIDALAEGLHETGLV
ncbi:MAG TPA: LysR family transcriptional regulator [Steroidobacteraceae bacterium]|nr:LysR family transcriptional regulator [Steroidobacteraceae bacterium]